jgi:SAM-dependent methyltransferase
MKNLFNKNYYEKGVELGISGYSNYRWIPEMTLPLSLSIVDYLKIDKNEILLDYGCAKGFLVKALRILGYKAYGTDISEYAIKNCDNDIEKYVCHLSQFSKIHHNKFDWIICKDVLEHVSYDDFEDVLNFIFKITDKIFIIVPLGKDGKYNIEEYEIDKTHYIREPVSWWVEKFEKSGFNLVKYDSKIKNIKENWAYSNNGNGFFTFKK